MTGKTYSGLEELVAHDARAKNYYGGLPDKIKEQLDLRADDVNSFARLQDYTENILGGSR